MQLAEPNVPEANGVSVKVTAPVGAIVEPLLESVTAIVQVVTSLTATVEGAQDTDVEVAR